MLKRSRFLRRFLRAVAVLIIITTVLLGYLVWVADTPPPRIADTGSLQLKRNQPDTGLYTIHNSWFRKSNSGLYEMYIEGPPFENGVINGKLSKELVQKQEDYFAAQITRMIPSKFYLNFLKYFIGWFNRNMPANVTEEYKDEIYGISFSASDDYKYIGTKYHRIFNYHSAHDIGHALQNMMLVGCTSFGTWGSASEDSSLIIGRNFDFYVGDDFAKNKIVLFNKPAKGYKFMSVTWAGFIGVVSGMNEKGLTVTINAAKSTIPTGSATPVSLVAREIVQYASTVEEAIAIARKRKMFVSESFLVGSAIDNKAVVIEKTPDSLAIYDPHQNKILCANHFQSNSFLNTAINQEQMKESASVYRYNRLSQLLRQNGKNTVPKTVAILRDFRGKDGSDIGLGNEKALNQFIAHHSVVFEPQKLRVWVSTSPWQMGEFVCYDLKKIFALNGLPQNKEVYEPGLTIQADSFINTARFQNFLKFRKNRQGAADGKKIVADSLIAENPTYYGSYVVAGDYFYKNQDCQQALSYYRKALTLEIATEGEKKHIEAMIKECLKR